MASSRGKLLIASCGAAALCLFLTFLVFERQRPADLESRKRADAALPAERSVVRANVEPRRRLDASSTLIVTDELSAPLENVGVWRSVPEMTALTHEASSYLGSTDRFGRFRMELPAGELTVVASTIGRRAATTVLKPSAESRVVLDRGATLEVRCVDLAGHPLAGIRMTLRYRAMVEEAAVAGDGFAPEAAPCVAAEQFHGVSNSEGVIAFGGLIPGRPFWGFHSDEFGLIDGPGFRDGQPMSVPGACTYVFAPLVAAGVEVTGDEVLEVRWLTKRLPVIISERSGATGRAMRRLKQRFPDLGTVHVFAAATTTNLTPFEVELLLDCNGPRQVTMPWRSIGEFLEVGPEKLVLPPAPANHVSHAAWLTLRLVNPDGSRLDGCEIALQGRRHSAGVISGARTRVPADTFRLHAPQPSVANSLPAGELRLEGGTDNEHLVSLTRNLRRVRILRPDAAQGQGACFMNIVSAPGGKMTLTLLNNQAEVMAYLPEQEMKLSARWSNGQSEPMSFQVDGREDQLLIVPRVAR